MQQPQPSDSPRSSVHVEVAVEPRTTGSSSDDDDHSGQALEGCSAQPPERWFESDERAVLDAWRSTRARQLLYEHHASALWVQVKASITEAITTYNSRTAEPMRVHCAETLGDGFAVTRFQYPLALIDIAIDIDSGMIACVYTFSAHPADAYRECIRVWLVRATETEIFLTAQDGHRLESLDQVGQQVLKPYLEHLRCRDC